MKILGMGVPELLIILLVVLLIFGPKNLPKLGASLGKTVKNIRKGMGDEDEGKKKIEEVEVVDDEDSDVVEEAVEEAEEVVEEAAEDAAKKATAKKRTTAAKAKAAKSEDDE
ncbi:MAG: twin-arginine translocase TatA/TatE family subunit [Coriobacteriales bacterium]|nr:twin-arginine translocase TatA/TatE family subunit [Coriobacteriales bacterium]